MSALVGPGSIEMGKHNFMPLKDLKPRKTNKHIINAIAYVSRIINFELYSIIMYFEVPPTCKSPGLTISWG